VPKPTPDELEAREWIFVNETNSTVFSFEGDYEKELTQVFSFFYTSSLTGRRRHRN